MFVAIHHDNVFKAVDVMAIEAIQKHLTEVF